MSDDLRWVATLSNGETVAEHSGEWTIKPGERKPWVRLCSYLAENDLHLTSLRINFRGRTIHLPRANFDRFGLDEKAVAPLFYSLAYHVEVDDVFDTRKQTDFIILTAHFKDFEVHYVQDTSDGNNSWVTVTQGHTPLAETPKAK